MGNDIWTLEEKLTAASRASWVGASIRADIRVIADDYDRATLAYRAECKRISAQFDRYGKNLESNLDSPAPAQAGA